MKGEELRFASRCDAYDLEEGSKLEASSFVFEKKGVG